VTPNLQFLINCCHCAPTAPAIREISEYAATLDQQALAELLSLARVHGVLPLVYQAVQRHATDTISKDCLAELKQQNLYVVMQNMAMSAELVRAVSLLQENGIRVLSFKGPALSRLAYGDVVLRQYVDLDILIKKQDIARSIALLTEDGYLPQISLSEGVNTAFYDCVNVIGLGKKICIEVHWALLSKNYAVDWPEKSLWQESDSVDIECKHISMLSFNNHLLYLCVHGAKHLFERLEWVCDIDRMVRTREAMVSTQENQLTREWSGLFEDAKVLGIERMLLLGLSLAHQLLALPLPKDISDKVLNDSAVQALHQQIISQNYSRQENRGRSYSTFGLLWRMRENYSDRMRFAWRAMFAPKFDDFKAVQLPAGLVFLYPFIRPFRLFFKYFGR